MTIYVLKNGVTGQIIEAYDTQASADAQKANLLKTGEYVKITVETLQVISDVVTDLAVVKVDGYLSANGPKFKISSYNPTGTVADSLTFTVASRLVSFTGYVNLTASEVNDPHITALSARVAQWIETEFSDRLLNDNPSTQNTSGGSGISDGTSGGSTSDGASGNSGTGV